MKAYFVIREDLQLSPAKLAIQVGHGVDLNWMNQSSIDGFAEWLDPAEGDRRKLLLKIGSEEQLANLIVAARLKLPLCALNFTQAFCCHS